MAGGIFPGERSGDPGNHGGADTGRNRRNELEVYRLQKEERFPDMEEKIDFGAGVSAAYYNG